MAKTNLQIKAKNAATEASITTTLTYVNPDADSATLKSFAKKLNALTTNNYDEANRIQSINVDTEETPKTPNTIQFVDNPQYTKYAQTISINVNQLIINGETMTTIPSDITIFGISSIPSSDGSYGISLNSNRTQLSINTISSPAIGTYNISLAIGETTTHTAATTTATITVS